MNKRNGSGVDGNISFREEVISGCKFSNSNNFNGVIGSVLATSKHNKTWEEWVAKGQLVFAEKVLADSDVQKSIECENIGGGLA